LNSAVKTDDDRERPAQRSAWAWWWYLGNGAALVTLVLVPVWIKTALHQFHNYDLGIMAQALHRIRSGNLNPFLPGLNLPLFNDHFDPIVVLFAPLSRLLEPAYAALTVEHVLILLSPLPVILLCRKQADQLWFACFATSYLLFNRGIVSALSYPVHPTTWAALFAVILAAAVAARRFALATLAAVLLMGCKEEFPFVVALLGLCLLLRKERKAGSAMLILACAWCIAAFALRPMLVGETHDYAGRVLRPILTHPIETLGRRLREGEGIRRFVLCILPLLPLALWLRKSRSSPDWTILAAVTPLLAIRFLDGAWKFHYMAPVAALILFTFWRREEARALPRRYAIAAAVIAIFTSIGPLAETVSVYASAPELRGPHRAALDEAMTILRRNPGGKALVEGNLTPLLAARPDVFQIGGPQPLQDYRFLMAEKPPAGDPWPLKPSDILRLIETWRQDSSLRILRDDAFVFLAEKR